MGNWRHASIEALRNNVEALVNTGFVRGISREVLKKGLTRKQCIQIIEKVINRKGRG